jgi:glutathione peroxidase
MKPDAQPTLNYQQSVTDIDGKTVTLEQYKGKKIIILNVASECGYTPQYTNWQDFYELHKDKVVVLGFPSNEFGGQEPGSAAEIKQFCTSKFQVTFPMFDKVKVKKGAEQHPLFQWLTDKKANGWNDKDPGWNFSKYLIDENGHLVSFFPSSVKPNDPEFVKALGL